MIGAHSLQHAYQQGFYIILVELYGALALTPVAAGALEMARRVASGVVTMGGGLLLDRLRHRRIQVLYLSLIAMGLGYALVGLAPTYAIILAAAVLASAAGSIWHPAALSLLSQRYPARRGFMIALHRSAGSVGDTAGPLLVGTLLLLVAWQGILYAALPLALVFTVWVWAILRRSPSWLAFRARASEPRPFRHQLRDLGGLFRSRGLLLLLVVSGLSGLSQGGLLLWLSLYLSREQGMTTFLVGVHIAMLTGVGIVTGPLLGRASDRAGRKPVIIGILGTKATIAVLMGLAGGGILLSILITLLGAVMFGVNSLVQAGALDLAEGRRLEGTMIGLLWGSNAVFTGGSPLLLGFLIQAMGFGILFWYVAAMSVVAMTAAIALPALGSGLLAGHLVPDDESVGPKT